MPDNDSRLLALDGGGVCGLSSLTILQNLISTIDPDSPPKPCDYFDIICSTSTLAAERDGNNTQLINLP
ncbi:hypothetical protein BGZ61DRAFT_457920 [Ilyonectria robusta]|uniref:uncharacterized protein n=1 Tax=Ilyonectria robusta TaxID=1079257 RepID=UPI001E8D7657|nr:uncharacterized protein BGZ61DRAFT_457920 [Ilyonectria robusta]KAH8674870.1 hypothetical protein BGZ61DRAFT_457920 [Ilyonectria robusta]